MAERSSPAEEVRRLYEEAEQRTARAMEDMVRRDSFGELLARVTENTMALSRIWFGVSDLFVRNLRIAGRQDVNRLGRQLARTEDKLEMVLQAVERLEAELAAQGEDAPRRGGRPAARSSPDGGGGKSGARGRSGGSGPGSSSSSGSR